MINYYILTIYLIIFNMYLFIVTFIFFSYFYWMYGIKYLNNLLYLWKREAKIMTFQKYINYYEKKNGKVFFIVNKKCRCKKKFKNKVKCLKCRIDNIINIEYCILLLTNPSDICVSCKNI